jgi:hypothetical protein
MPLLPLPTGGSSLTGGDVPVSGTDDVLAALPLFLRATDSAPIRDAIVAALTAIFIGYQEGATYAAEQSDTLRATDTYLRGFAQELKTFAKPGESDQSLRARMLAVQGLVTPKAILAAASALLAPFTTVHAQIAESIQDRWFVRSLSATGDWHSYVWQTTRSRSPTYPDRLYPDDAAINGGDVRPDSNPGGARVWRDTVGRSFFLRLPDLSPLDSLVAAACAGGPGPAPYSKSYFTVGTGTNATNATFVRNVSASALSVYQSVTNTVERLRGSSIRWTLYVDPKLTS